MTNGQRRRCRLWETCGKIGIFPSDIKDTRGGAYIIIVPEETTEKLVNEENKTVFRQEGFDIITPVEFNALKSVVVTHVDKIINEYTLEEIKQNVEEKNQFAKVEEVVKITNTGMLVKIRFSSTQMVVRALREGLILLHQRIPPHCVEKVVYVKLSP